MMCQILTSDELQIIKRAEEITTTDYNRVKMIFPANNYIKLVANLLCEIDNWKEKYEDFKKDVEDNYVPRAINDSYYGVSRND